MARRKKGRAIDGVLLLDKVTGISSNRALQTIKRLFQAQKAGHTGSLDPLASGLLPICLGEATKFSQYLLNADKSYRAEIILGESTDSADADGQLIKQQDARHISRSDVEKILTEFSGAIEQVPPMYSALKHQGQPLYKLARKGIVLERKPRNVTIHALEIVCFNAAQRSLLTIDVRCSKGTYIRSLAHDIGERLGVGGHISQLRRTAVSSFCLSAAISELELRQQLQHNSAKVDCLDTHLLSIESMLAHFPRLQLGAEQVQKLRFGQAIPWMSDIHQGTVRLVAAEDDRFIGLGELKPEGCISPKRLIAQAV